MGRCSPLDQGEDSPRRPALSIGPREARRAMPARVSRPSDRFRDEGHGAAGFEHSPVCRCDPPAARPAVGWGSGDLATSCGPDAPHVLRMPDGRVAGWLTHDPHDPHDPHVRHGSHASGWQGSGSQSDEKGVRRLRRRQRESQWQSQSRQQRKRPVSATRVMVHPSSHVSRPIVPSHISA